MIDKKNTDQLETKKEEKQDELNKKTIETEEQKKKKLWKYLIYFAVIILITAGVLIYNLFQRVEEADNRFVYELIPEYIGRMNYTYLAIFFGVILLGFLLNAFIMFLYARLYHRRYKYHQGLAIQAIDNFYSSITPGAYGGEFAKVYFFNRQGIALSNAASIIVMNFIVYQISLCLIGFISILTRFDQILSIPAFGIVIGEEYTLPIPFYVFIILGFFLNCFVMALMIFMSISRRLHNFVINKVVKFLGKIKLVKNVEEKQESLRLQVENYRVELRRLSSNIPFALIMFFLTLLAIIVGGVYPFLSGLTLGGFEEYENVNYALKIYDSIVFSNFHQMVTGLVPIPGTAGIAEYVFERLFGAGSGYFSEAFYRYGGGNTVLIFWRMVTFYIPFMIYGIVAATYKSRGVPPEERLVPIGNRKTFVTMSIDTMDERKETLDDKLAVFDKNKKGKR